MEKKKWKKSVVKRKTNDSYEIAPCGKKIELGYEIKSKEKKLLLL